VIDEMSEQDSSNQGSNNEESNDSTEDVVTVEGYISDSYSRSDLQEDGETTLEEAAKKEEQEVLLDNPELLFNLLSATTNDNPEIRDVVTELEETLNYIRDNRSEDPEAVSYALDDLETQITELKELLRI